MDRPGRGRSTSGFGQIRSKFRGVIRADQSIYNLMTRHVELEVLPAAISYGIGVIPWSPLQGGLPASNRLANSRCQVMSIEPVVCAPPGVSRDVASGRNVAFSRLRRRRASGSRVHDP